MILTVVSDNKIKYHESEKIGGHSVMNDKIQKLFVPFLKPTSLICRRNFAFLVGNFISQKEVEGIFIEAHIQMFS